MLEVMVTAWEKVDGRLWLQIQENNAAEYKLNKVICNKKKL